MKVCFITHSYPPAETAAASYSKSFVSELVKSGIDVVLITASRNQLKSIEKHEGLTIYRLPLEMPIAIDFLEFLSKVSVILNKVHEKENFELIHSEHLFPAIYAGDFAYKNNLPHIVTIEGVSNVSIYSKILFQYHKFWLPRIKADKIVSWSRFLIDDYFLKWGIKKDKMDVIPGVVDINKFNPFVRYSHRKGLGNKKKQIITAKPFYFTNALGILYTIKAMKYVIERYKDCELVIGGTGRMESVLKNFVKNVDLGNCIKFLGWVPHNDMPMFYRAADVVVDSFVFRHPGSITVLESLASGTPNVLTKIECVPGEKNIPNNSIAVLSNPKDSESIGNGILKLLENKNYGKRLAKNAWEFVKGNFTFEKIIKKYKTLYETIL